MVYRRPVHFLAFEVGGGDRVVLAPELRPGLVELESHPVGLVRRRDIIREIAAAFVGERDTVYEIEMVVRHAPLTLK